ncbi:hypothetical protein [uncultured Roseobacter sp.]|uniref:hypothetical protein n=1 Tax=uncultured Roseobacter sp. TaxID=114847 RepID=UPI00262E8E07|nr:hypothetical protein [uncultured Roseobacter sp.]
MRQLFLAALTCVLTTQPAFATGDVYCTAVDGSDATFGYGFGRVPGLAIISATISVGGQEWSMVEEKDAIPIRVAQGAHDGPHTIIDFTDLEYSEIIASVRIISAVVGDDYRAVGLLRVPNVGVFGMTCE